MSQESMRRLAGAMQKDEALRKKFASAKSDEERKKLAAEHGLKVSAEDLKASAAVWNQGEVSDAELEDVSGGLRSCAKGAHIKDARFVVR